MEGPEKCSYILCKRDSTSSRFFEVELVKRGRKRREHTLSRDLLWANSADGGDEKKPLVAADENVSYASLMSSRF
ncbi:hypothetical protein SAY86_012230 [Trapa natans]|uniref:Uncharacterized protein n=1 Tax=Trapa natans TaxID=22666 RepID=A0AAN7RBE3_TRANT|nr:hypothetical protein SAY86_012230 [Trapa natans]